MSQSRGLWTVSLLALLAVVCTLGTPVPVAAQAQDAESAVRQGFEKIVAAINGRDAEAVWNLLAAKSKADAERIARGVRDGYAKASAEEKAKQEKNLGLKATELQGLDGKGYLKTAGFWRRYRELPGSKVDRVTVSGENATVHYVETDGDREKAIFVLEEGAWKAWLGVPRPTTTPADPVPADNRPPKPVPLAEVGKHVGEPCIIEMEVKSTGRTGSMVFLNSEPKFRDDKNFTVVLRQGALDKLKEAKIDDPVNHFKGKSVRVTGTVSLYREKAQILVDESEKVQIVESKRP